MFNDKGRVKRMLNELSNAGIIKRINLAGGEPLIFGESIIELARDIKALGLEASMITNGYRLDAYPEIFKYLDMIGISIDSLDWEICKKIGRCNGENYLSKDKLAGIVALIRDVNPHTKLKFNVVINRHNYDTRIANQLLEFAPDKIKILRQLPFRDDKGITNEQFTRFINLNAEAIGQTYVSVEDNDDMTQSYLMIDPHGCFFQNGNDDRGYRYSDPIDKVGFERAFSQIEFDVDKHIGRYGRVA